MLLAFGGWFCGGLCWRRILLAPLKCISEKAVGGGEGCFIDVPLLSRACFGIDKAYIFMSCCFVAKRPRLFASNDLSRVLILFSKAFAKTHLTSDQVGLPAELKHINKQRKRN
jgi:hypothetical protein